MNEYYCEYVGYNLYSVKKNDEYNNLNHYAQPGHVFRRCGDKCLALEDNKYTPLEGPCCGQIIVQPPKGYPKSSITYLGKLV